MKKLDIEVKLKESAAEFERHFEKYFLHDDEDIKRVTDAMRYSAMAGGKRIRPFIVNEFCKLFGGKTDASMPLACALECVHTYSLIHDDLPCMDNDDLRRGKPTCHKAYGEEFALLAGDALLTYAFEIIADAKLLSDKVKIEAVRLISTLAGVCGMVGGQTIDLESEGKHIGMEKLMKLHSLKTGALMRCAALLGAVAADAGEAERKAADDYASKIGLAFQIADDILDVTADESELGKPIGSDAQNKKVTFLTFMNINEAREYAQRSAVLAKDAIKSYDGSDALLVLADYIVNRNK
ncbi:MAG: polyprenyl synthetase family protein [Clostridia bacterium]|nr:polyprenyl synthetase family protein [Clostridia bacterium]